MFRRFTIALLALLPFVLLSPAAQAQPAGYSYGRAITVQSDQVSGSDSLVDFPLYVTIQANDLRDTLNGGFVCHASGYDLKFMQPDCSTTLDHQVEDYDPVSGTLNTWVRIPELRTDSNTVIYLFYGNSSVSSDSSSTGTWDSHYVGVWHMSEDPSGTNPAITDHSAFGHDADANSVSTDVRTNGKAGQAIALNGSTHYLSVDSSGLTPAALAFSGQDKISISAWVKFDDLSGEESVVELSHFTNDEDIGYYMGYGSGKMQIRLATTSPLTGNRYNGSTSLSTGIWYHMAYTYDGTTLKGYLNGVEEISTSRSGNISHEAADLFKIGKRQDGRYTDATIDEVRISRVARSADWIASQTANISDPESFYEVSIYTTAAALCSSGVPEPSIPDLSCYTGRISFAVDNSQVSGSSNLTDFPALIVLQHDTLKQVGDGGLMENANGWDISFTAADETTELDFELETYDADSGLIKAWVKIPTLYYNIDTELFCYIGCSETNTDPSTAETWSNNYQAVWHMSEATNGTGEALEDHSESGSNATPRGFSSDTRESALIEDGIRVDGTSEYFSVEDGSAVPSHLTFEDSSAITLSGWVNLDAMSGEESLFEKSQGTSDNQIRYWLGLNNNVMQVRLHAGTTSGRHDGTTTLSTGKDHFLVMTYNGTALLGYLDGVEEISVARTGNIVHNSGDGLLLGKRTDARFLDGVLEELRISSVARSAGWIQTTYNNQSDPENFISSLTIGGNPLPVALLSFEGASREAHVDLFWSTATEMQAASYTVERSPNGQQWASVDQKTAVGNSTQRNDYRAVDLTPLTGQSYYRLLQHDQDGTIYNIGMFALWRESNAPRPWQVFPNPNTGRSVSFGGLLEGEEYRVAVLESSGRLIGGWSLSSSEMTLPNLSPGLYAIRLTHPASGRSEVLRLSVR